MELGGEEEEPRVAAAAAAAVVEGEAKLPMAEVEVEEGFGGLGGGGFLGVGGRVAIGGGGGKGGGDDAEMPRGDAAGGGARGARGAAAVEAARHVGARLRHQLPPRVPAIAEHYGGVHGGGAGGGDPIAQQYIG